MSVVTVTYGLDKYGATMNLGEVLQELGVSERTLRDGINAGQFPQSRQRGKWSTEMVMRAAAGCYEKEYINAERGSPTSGSGQRDPFLPGAIPQNGSPA